MTQARKSFIAWLQAAPMMLIFALFFLLPLVLVTIVSAWDYNEYEMIPAFSLRGYSDTFEGCIADLPNLCTILKTYLKTLKLCLLTWGLTLLIGFTVAYFLAFHVRSKTWQILLTLLCTIPFWTSNVIRMIAWIPLLGRNGLVNRGLEGMGLINAPLEWLLFSEAGQFVWPDLCQHGARTLHELGASDSPVDGRFLQAVQGSLTADLACTYCLHDPVWRARERPFFVLA